MSRVQALHPVLLDHLQAVNRFQEAMTACRASGVTLRHIPDSIRDLSVEVDRTLLRLQQLDKSCANCSGSRRLAHGPLAGARRCLVNRRLVGDRECCEVWLPNEDSNRVS